MKEIWVPLSGAISQQKKVDTIANNVANANTPGFKRDKITFSEYLTVLEKGNRDIDLPNKEWKPEDFYKSYGSENSFVKVNGSYTVHSQGDLVPTGSPLDLAIHGKGFFEVLTPNGVRYTRKGIFTLSNEGILITKEGYPILSKMDATDLDPKIPIEQQRPPQNRIIRVQSGKLNVTKNGNIFVNNNRAGELSLVEFKDQSSLKKEGHSMFINANLANIITDPSKSNIHQGFIEQSNVNIVGEMSELIKAHRNFESIQRVIKTYDNIAGKSSNELLKF